MCKAISFANATLAVSVHINTYLKNDSGHFIFTLFVGLEMVCLITKCAVAINFFIFAASEGT